MLTLYFALGLLYDRIDHIDHIDRIDRIDRNAAQTVFLTKYSVCDISCEKKLTNILCPTSSLQASRCMAGK